MIFKKIIKGFFILLLLLAIILGIWIYSNFTVQITRVEYSSNKVSNELKIVQISDLHGQEFHKNNTRLAKKVNDLKPDIILLTGDMFSSKDAVGKEKALSFIKQLQVPIYLSTGEHDRDHDYLRRAKKMGVIPLQYQYETIQVKGNNVRIYGIDNVYFTSTFNLLNEFETPPEDSLNILMSHIPNFDAFVKWGADITFSGDTHGGIFRLPFIGPAYLDGVWFPKLTTKEPCYDKGLFEKEDKAMFISSGLGSDPVPARFCNRPEIVEFIVNPK